MNSWVFITQQPKSPQEALEGVVLINQTKAWRVWARQEEARGSGQQKWSRFRSWTWPSWKKSLPALENSVYLLTYPLPASSEQRDPGPNPCSPAGDSRRLGRARWEGRAGYVLLISGETAPRRNAKLLQGLIGVKGFLSTTAPPSAQGTCLQNVWPFGVVEWEEKGEPRVTGIFWEEKGTAEPGGKNR